MQKGNIGVTTENIFPVIKKFLYSDHEIFLRELVSNAVDATQKLKTLSSIGEFKGELGDLTVHVSLDKETITVSDRGIGMTTDEIDKYINQIAFSGANDFLEKYKNDANAIIGHFGLGFYSAFMVAKKVEIITKSWKDDAKAVKWTCDGSPEFTLEEVEKQERGTDIVLYIDDDCKEFLEENRLSSLLKKYCSFLPVPIAFGKKKEWKDGKQVETAEDNIINEPNPLWTRKPSELKEEDYKEFYRKLYPMSDEPLFWIHLNVDYPFHLTGILYFPKLKEQFGGIEGQIKLYSGHMTAEEAAKLGVEKATPEQTRIYFKNLNQAHKAAGRSVIWADMETFQCEGKVYHSPMVGADGARIKAQMESISDYVEEIIIYIYQGTMNPPDPKVLCGHPSTVKLYRDLFLD